MDPRRCWQAIDEACRRVHEDISIAALDDEVIAQYMPPQLTTLAFPYAVKGELPVDLLLDDDAEHRERLVPMPIRIRGSEAFTPASP